MQKKSGACSLFFCRRWRDKRWFYCWWRYLFIRFALPRLSLVFLSLFTFSFIFLKIQLDSRHSRVKATWGDGARSETIFHHPFTFKSSMRTSGNILSWSQVLKIIHFFTNVTAMTSFKNQTRFTVLIISSLLKATQGNEDEMLSFVEIYNLLFFSAFYGLE